MSGGRYGTTLHWQRAYKLQRGIEYVQLEPVELRLVLPLLSTNLSREFRRF